MKKKLVISLIIVIIAWYLLAISTSANADGLRIQSPRGMTQAQWESTPEYQAFKCPEGYGRGIGVDLNFTTDRSDDYWFVECTKIEVRPVIVSPLPEVPKPTEQPKVDSLTAVIATSNSQATNPQPKQSNNYVPQTIIQETTTIVLDTRTVAVRVEPLGTQTTTLIATAINGQVVVEKRTTRPIYRWRYLREYSE